MRAATQGLVCLLGAVIAAGLACPAWSEYLYLQPPGPREFVADHAYLIDDADKDAVVQTCDTLLTEMACPIIVVTVEAMDEYGGQGMSIDAFARILFDQWGIGSPEHNVGILFLISDGDRKAWIQLGAAWDSQYDAVCQRIMDEQVIPRFKRGKFSAGIVAGVNSLDRMARGLELPSAPVPVSHILIGLGVLGLAIFTIVSLVRRGGSGWAWLFWGGLFALLGFILYHALTQRRRGYAGGSFGGGSFGGGFSGGGGAGGSW